MSDPTNPINQIRHEDTSALPPRTPSLDDVLEAFEQAWNDQHNVLIEDFVPPDNHPEFGEIVTELLCIDLERRFKSGEEKSISRYLEELPHLFERASILERLAFEEYRLLATNGDRVHPSTYQKRYRIRTDHWPLLNQHPQTPSTALSNHAVSTSVSEEMERITGVTKPLPEIGDEFLGFEIREQLGACRFGRVYLARQKTLADRHVVIKVTSNLWSESDVLARLQHTNIVPIYSVHQDSGLQAVCMPFLGRRTLASFLIKLKQKRGQPSQAIIDSWIEEGCKSGDSACRLPKRQLDYLQSLSFEELCVWIIANIATGLAQAHDRGISHRDLKPANILLTDEFQPLILDFNLSEDGLSTGRGALLVGGTLPYMAPEHLQAVVAEGQIDERSDLYSLGVIFFELLTGELPYPIQDGSIIGNLSYLIDARSKSPPSSRSLSLQISVDVDSIVERCLAADPNQRYQTAQQLQEDLETHLQHLPLKHASNRSVAQRFQKWTRRHPRIVSFSTVVTVSLVLLSILAGLAFSRGKTIAHQKAIESWEHFQELVAEAAPALSMSRDSELLSVGFQKAEAAFAIYDAATDDWETQASVRRLGSSRREVLFASVQKLHYLVANAALRKSRALVAADRNQELEHAELHNSYAREMVGANKTPRALLLQAASIAVERGYNEEAETLRSDADRASHEDSNSRLLLAIQSMAEFDYTSALTLLSGLNNETPSDYVVLLLLGNCHFALHEPHTAEAYYSSCIALSPGNYIAYFHRGLARMQSQRFEPADSDFTKAFELRPNCTTAILNRAIARMRSRKFEDATSDLSMAIQLGREDALVYFLRSQANKQLGQVDLTEADLQSAMCRSPVTVQGWIQRSLETRLTNSTVALHELEQALRLNPRSSTALQNKVALLSQLNKHQAAVETLTDLLNVTPRSATAFLARGLLQAKLSQRDSAIADGLAGLEVSNAATHHYQMARILAQTGSSENDDVQRAVSHIRTALADEPQLAILMDEDQELSAVLNTPDVRTLLLTAKSLLTN